MTLYATVVAITILATVVNLACSWVVWARLRKASAGTAPGWWTPDQVRAMESVNPGETILLTTDQHFTADQISAFREWSEGFTKEHGIKLVLLTGGLMPKVVLKTDSRDPLDAARMDDAEPLLVPAREFDLVTPSDVVMAIQRDASGRLSASGIAINPAVAAKLDANSASLSLKTPEADSAVRSQSRSSDSVGLAASHATQPWWLRALSRLRSPFS